MRPLGGGMGRLGGAARRLPAAVVVAALAMGGLTAVGLTAAASAAAALSPIHHVYVIVLENENASTTFGPGSPAPYLSHTLRAQGAYLPRYYAIGHQSNDNYIAMISGQAPNVDTQADCQFYTDFLGAGFGSYGQELGLGCVYPAAVQTLAGQMQAAHLAWRDYNESMGANPQRESAVCGHPAVNSRDGTQTASAADQYSARHNPFVYFHSIIDDTTLCDTHVVGLDALPQDLANNDAPDYVFITPNLCSDGHDSPCADGQHGGLPAADAFLRQWVPRITGSEDFKRDGGLLIITFDEAATSDASACCGEIPGPGSPQPGAVGPGGGNIGTVLLSPYIKPGTVSQQPYNHYTMLRSVEDLFGLSHLGYAALPGERSFGSDVFACAPTRAPLPHGGRLPAGSEFVNLRARHRGRHEQLSLYSVGASSLKVTATARGRRRVVVRQTLTPCRSYTLNLPAPPAHARGRTWHVSVVAAVAGAGSQTAGMAY